MMKYVWICDYCGKSTEPGVGTPAGWYTVNPPQGQTHYFDTVNCMASWANAQEPAPEPAPAP
jgi:ribosomal protein L24E